MVGKNSLGTTLRTVYGGLKSMESIFNLWETEIPNYGEAIYLGTTSYNNLNQQIHWEALSEIKSKYLIEGTILNQTYHDQITGHSKAVRLTNSYFKNGKFDYPICTHWNPRNDAIQVHPGSSRNSIIQLFNPDGIVDMYYFSTYGVKPKWLDLFTKLDYDYFKNISQKYDLENKLLWISVSADHGTFIPHITVDGHQTGPQGKIWHERCKSILDTQTIWVNTEVPELHLFKKTMDKNTADKIIYIKDDLTIQDSLRLSILVFLNYDWEDSSFKISSKNPIPYEFAQ